MYRQHCVSATTEYYLRLIVKSTHFAPDLPIDQGTYCGAVFRDGDWHARYPRTTAAQAATLGWYRKYPAFNVGSVYGGVLMYMPCMYIYVGSRHSGL